MTQNAEAARGNEVLVPYRESARPVTISDPQAIRALAHEARLEVLEELFSSQATRTATELASRCHLTPSAMSYHLRALEKYGYVERSASEGDGRERRWKAAGDQLVVGSLNTSVAAKNAFLNVQLNTFRDRLVAELARRDAERAAGVTPKNKRPPVLSTGMLFLNEEQRDEFIRRMYALVDEYETLAKPDERAVDADRVYYMMSFLPDARSE